MSAFLFKHRRSYICRPCRLLFMLVSAEVWTDWCCLCVWLQNSFCTVTPDRKSSRLYYLSICTSSLFCTFLQIDFFNVIFRIVVFTNDMNRHEPPYLHLFSVPVIRGEFLELPSNDPIRSLAEEETVLPCRYAPASDVNVVQVTWYKETPDGKEQIITAHHSNGQTGLLIFLSLTRCGHGQFTNPGPHPQVLNPLLQ